MMIRSLLICFFFFCQIIFGRSEEELLQKSGSCSKKCQNTTLSEENNPTNATEEIFSKFPCSCSSSCSIYKDCCHDSAFRDGGMNLETPHWMCISVAKKGKFRAIFKCPRDWSEPSHFCTDSIGYLPPVTSMITGATYANIYCAICHGDGEKLKTWTVDLRCCADHENSQDDAERHFVYRKGNLWSRIRDKGQCICKYHAHHSGSFLDALELRTCERRQEVSKCSSSWHRDTDEKMCKSFLDPIYLSNKIYRNQYCALCNYKRLEDAQCGPAVVERMRSEGSESEEIFQHCLRHRLSSCLYYFTSLNRGRSYSFSDLLSIREQSCVPELGKRCCRGERYDFRSKRCRKLTS